MLTSLLCAWIQDVPKISVEPSVKTEAVATDADDPAIWVNRLNPSKSLILGTDKIEKVGGLYVFNLDGKVVQRIPNLDRPNNVDVEQEVRLGTRKMDIAAVTERDQNRILIYQILPSGKLKDITGQTGIYAGTAEAGKPMGVTIFRRKSGAEVLVSRTQVRPGEAIMRFRLAWNEKTQKADLRAIDRFGSLEGKDEIESLSADEATGRVYFSDEGFGVHFGALTNSYRPAGKLGSGFYTGDHEGTATYATKVGPAFFVSCDQNKGESLYYFYPRTAPTGAAPLFVLAGADDTDGIDVTGEPLGPKFPNGILVAMNSKDRNFWVYDMKEVLRLAPGQ